jgi:hypothetical protein
VVGIAKEVGSTEDLDLPKLAKMEAGMNDLNLPAEIARACAPLFDALPLDDAMPHLTGSHPKLTEIVESILLEPTLAYLPELAAGLWLYVDNLERSHTVSQGIESPIGSYWHGIMHRREGDFSNSHYWMNRASGHPLIAELDSDEFVDLVSKAAGTDDPALVERQRNEWKALFEWCCA